MMDELPAIIHRLSLQLWCPDQANKGADAEEEVTDDRGVNPFASPPSDPVDANGNLLDPNAVSEISLNGGGEVQSLFSQKNLLRLAALTDSHRTLSLFTPGIRDVVFRAWTGNGDRSEAPTPAMATPSLTKTHSFHAGASTTYTFSDTGSAAHGHLPARPSLVSLNSATTGLSLGSGGRARTGRKKKTRVVNLRRTKSEATTPEATSESNSDTASVNIPLSEPVVSDAIPEEPEEGSVVVEAPTPGKVRFRSAENNPLPPRRPLISDLYKRPEDLSEAASFMRSFNRAESTEQSRETVAPNVAARMSDEKSRRMLEEAQSINSETPSVILREAWIMKMADEIAKRVYDDEKNRQQGIWEEREDIPPPAYEAATR